MELIEEIAKAIAANYSMKYTGRDEALACLPVFERWLRAKPLGILASGYDRAENTVLQGLADELAAMQEEAQPSAPAKCPECGGSGGWWVNHSIHDQEWAPCPVCKPDAQDGGNGDK